MEENEHKPEQELTLAERNKDIGFRYFVTDEQIAAHQKRSVKEIFDWIFETNAFIYDLQTEEERMRKYIFKPAKRIAHFGTPEIWEELKRLYG